MKASKHFRIRSAILLLSFGVAFGFSLNPLCAQEAEAPKKQYPVKDSANLSEKQKMRQWSYETYNTEFPAKRQNKFSLGIQIGNSFLSGDVVPKMALAGGINVQKSIGHLLSFRGQIAAGQAFGRNWRPSGGFVKNAAWNGFSNPAADYINLAPFYLVFYNHKTVWYDLNVQTVFAINNINHYKEKPKLGLFIFTGIGAFFYQTKIDALDASGNVYDFSVVTVSQSRDDKKEIVGQLKGLLDGTYETSGESFDNVAGLFNSKVVFEIVGGASLNYRLSDRIYLSFEHRLLWNGDDLIDGHQWSETNTKTPSPDLHQFSTAGLNFMLGKGEDPDWFTNPMSTVYDDLRDIKKKMEKDESDKDGDGVPDSKDKDNLTPAGTLTDHHGVAIDSDGDGIPDFRDGEPYSIKGAAVDKSGNMMDTDGDRVPDIFDDEPNSETDAQVDTRGRTIKTGKGSGDSGAGLGNFLPMIHFEFGSAKIAREFYPDLHYVASYLRSNPDVSIGIIGHADSRGQAESNASLSARRAQNCVEFLVRTYGIDRDRLSVQAKGSEAPMVGSIPAEGEFGAEEYHYLNRRVEFQIIGK